MAAFLDAVRFTPTAGGTTDWTVSAAVAGYMTPATAGATNGKVYKYRAESANLSQWELGEGTYTSGVLSRTAVLFNSLGTTAKINFSAAPQVAIVALSDDLSRRDSAYFSASLSANQTGIANGTFTKVQVNSEQSDPSGWYDNATNYRFQPLLPGRYAMVAQLQANGTTLTTAIAAIYKNGIIHAQGASSVTGTFASASCSKTVQFNGSTDYAEMFGYIEAASGHTFTGTGGAQIRTWFEAYYLGP